MVHYFPGKIKIGIDPLMFKYKNLAILEKGINHIVGTGENLGFKDNTIDIIICFNVLDHSKIPQNVLKEMARVIKKEGNIIFHSHFVVFWAKLFRILFKFFDKPHPWHFTKREIKRMFLETNLEQKFINTTIFHWRARNPLKRIIAKMIIRNYFAVLEKK